MGLPVGGTFFAAHIRLQRLLHGLEALLHHQHVGEAAFLRAVRV